MIQFSRAVIRNEPHFQLLDDHFHNLGYEMGRNYRLFFIILLAIVFHRDSVTIEIPLREHSLRKI